MYPLVRIDPDALIETAVALWVIVLVRVVLM